MALTVITLINAPPSLRGDLSKWLQEISTGVYVGDINRKVREQLWERTKQTVAKGQATITYVTNNELGYDFDMHQTEFQRVTLDDIPLVMVPLNNLENRTDNMDKGFSNAAKYRQAKKFTKKKLKITVPYVVLDVETTGLDIQKCELIEIAAIKYKGNQLQYFEKLIKIDNLLSETIISLTGITDELIKSEGEPLESVLYELVDFIEDLPIVGFNINFDLSIINHQFILNDKKVIKNKSYDLLKFVKKEKMYLKTYTLDSVLHEYGIPVKKRHRAMADTKLTFELSKKVNKFEEKLFKDYDKTKES